MQSDITQNTRRQTGLTQERLKEVLDYSPTTGRFRWRVRQGNMSPGCEAGTSSCSGYRAIRVDGLQHLAHRLAWLYVHGKHPAGEIDHRNGKPGGQSYCQPARHPAAAKPVECRAPRPIRSCRGLSARGQVAGQNHCERPVDPSRYVRQQDGSRGRLPVRGAPASWRVREKCSPANARPTICARGSGRRLAVRGLRDRALRSTRSPRLIWRARAAWPQAPATRHRVRCHVLEAGRCFAKP